MQWNEPTCYAVKHKDENVVAASRSGGIFTALSDMVLKENGVVYGCVLTDDFRAVHVRAEDEQTRNRMRGSKYIQSSLGDTFRNVKADLTAGRKVLFSGTSCQIAGLSNFLGRKWNSLLCVDIVCHGVPSPKVWRAYIDWQEQKHSGKVATVDFRNKKAFGWHDHIETLTMQNGAVVHSKVFTTLFYQHNVLRPSCYECPHKRVIHPGDITIADYWGIEKAAPSFDDDKGVSLVLINNAHGAEAFELIKSGLKWQQTKLEDSIQMPLVRPFEKPEEREQFWTDFQNKEFYKIADKYTGTSLMARGKRKLKAIYRNWRKRCSKGRGIS